MSEPRCRRVAISVTEREYDALVAMANRERKPVSGAAAELVRRHLTPGQVSASGPGRVPAPEGDRPAARVGPAWLPPLVEAERGEWARTRAVAVQLLIERYPEELDDLQNTWATDAPVREQVWALTVWRDLLDIGAFEDPRVEISFAVALSDFASYLRDRGRPGGRRRH